MNHEAKVYVAGHTGLVGSAILRALQQKGYTNITTRTLAELDLRNQQQVHDFFATEKPEYVFVAAAKVGGIKANTEYPASFIYDNLMIEVNVIHAAYTHNVKKLLFLGSSCIYPRLCPQPIAEEYLLTGELEKTNKPYAVAKIAGITLCEAYNRQYGANFISCMPTNLYGPHDNFDLESSHVIPALIAKMHKAKIEGESHVILWGNGKPRREFLFIDDLADALIFLMNTYTDSMPINVGVGEDITIAELAEFIKEVVGYTGEIVFNQNHLDGAPRKLLNVNKLHALGWKAQTTLQEGLKITYEWYQNYNKQCNFLKTTQQEASV